MDIVMLWQQLTFSMHFDSSESACSIYKDTATGRVTAHPYPEAQVNGKKAMWFEPYIVRAEHGFSRHVRH